MNNLKSESSVLNELIKDVAKTQKKGLPFIITSVIIWILIFITSGLRLPIGTRNIITFCCSCPLMPIAYIIGRIMKVNIFEKRNPLSKVGFIFTCNQMIYLLIVMWVFSAVPEKMVMVYAMVFGAHLLPYSWLYKSKAYLVFSIIEPILALALGCVYGSQFLALVMIVLEIILSLVLVIESRRM